MKVFFLFFLAGIATDPVSTGSTHHSSDRNWGFWAHKRINRLAVLRLPPEMMVFFKPNLDYLTENAVNPDKRRYAVVGEAEKHYIDLDVYGDSAFSLPRQWSAAVDKFGEDSLRRHGIAPWAIQSVVYQLTEAFQSKNPARILRLSADLGHYIADIHVPLHTTRNYNGQLSGQDGIHGFWESRIPELFAEKYDFLLGGCDYVENPSAAIWQTVFDSNAACDTVFRSERELTLELGENRKYIYEERGGVTVRTYSREFSERYHKLLEGQVERRMRSAVRMVGDLWYSCWVNAGQPDLSSIRSFAFDEKARHSEQEEKRSWLQRLIRTRSVDEN